MVYTTAVASAASATDDDGRDSSDSSERESSETPPRDVSIDAEIELAVTNVAANSLELSASEGKDCTKAA